MYVILNVDTGPAFSSKWGDEIREHGAYTFESTNWKYNQLMNIKQIPERKKTLHRSILEMVS